MRRALLCALALAASDASGIRAQGIALGASYGSHALLEGGAVRSRSTGSGVGFSAEWRRNRLGVRVDLDRTSLTPDDTARAAFKLTQFSLRLSYQTLAARRAGPGESPVERNQPTFDVELGISRRSSSPVFATQDVGAVSLGVRSEARLGQDAGVWARGAFLPVVRCNGGGSNGASIELGLGTWLTLMHGRARAELDYAMQRVDRTVLGADVPLQVGITRFTLMFHL